MSISIRIALGLVLLNLGWAAGVKLGLIQLTQLQLNLIWISGIIICLLSSKQLSKQLSMVPIILGTALIAELYGIHQGYYSYLLEIQLWGVPLCVLGCWMALGWLSINISSQLHGSRLGSRLARSLLSGCLCLGWGLQIEPLGGALGWWKYRWERLEAPWQLNFHGVPLSMFGGWFWLGCIWGLLLAFPAARDLRLAYLGYSMLMGFGLILAAGVIWNGFILGSLGIMGLSLGMRKLFHAAEVDPIPN